MLTLCVELRRDALACRCPGGVTRPSTRLYDFKITRFAGPVSILSVEYILGPQSLDSPAHGDPESKEGGILIEEGNLISSLWSLRKPRVP
jgi:hypothetical protein